MTSKPALVTSNIGFVFSNPKVDVKLNSSYDELGNPYKTIRLKEINESIGFQYRDKLIKTNDTVTRNDILTRLLSVGTEDSLIKFLNEYGFLFRSDTEKYALYSCEELLRVIKRIGYLIELIMEIHSDWPSYKIISNNLLQLMLSYPAKVYDLSSEGNPRVFYQSPEHQIRKNLISIGVLTIETDYHHFEDVDPDPNFQYFEEQYLQFEENHHYFMDLEQDLQVQHDFLDYILSKTAINSVELTKGVVLTKPLSIRPNEDEIKTIINAAQLVIKAEIDYHTSLISPVYDLESMIGTWQIPNLITAIYFAIFFLNPNFTLIKKCANPTCDEYFDVLNSNKRKKYCSTRCSNIMSQRKYREVHDK
jgi:preprotein translocase subunit Sss1